MKYMQSEKGCNSDSLTINSAIKACTNPVHFVTKIVLAAPSFGL